MTEDECQSGGFSHKDSPFSKKTTPFSRTDSPFSKKTSPFSEKDSPYSKQIICEALLQENGWPLLAEDKVRLRP